MRIPRIDAIYIVLWYMGLAVGLSSCLQSHGIYMADIDPKAWSPSDPVTISYPNEDTLSLQDLHVVIRFCNYFEYDRLGLEITTTTPDGYHWRDTLYVDIQKHRPSSELYIEREQPYRQNVTFLQKGGYLFSFAPVMPNVPIQGIAAAGMQIIKKPSPPMTSIEMSDSSRFTR